MKILLLMNITIYFSNIYFEVYLEIYECLNLIILSLLK